MGGQLSHGVDSWLDHCIEGLALVNILNVVGKDAVFDKGSALINHNIN